MNFFYSLVIGTGILSILAFTTIDSTKNTVDIRKLICTVYDKKLISNTSCTTKPINRHQTIVRMNFYFNSQADDGMVNIKVYKKFNVVYKPFLVDVTENYCDALAKKPGAPYSRMFLAMAGSNSNLNHTCPYEGWIIVNIVTLDLGQMKVLMPGGEYRVDAMFSFNKNPLIAFKSQLFLDFNEKN